ncbi:MAG: hypothetical protein GY906_31700 [bacterium]|nr:hypothetical protein [bacterium]
MSITAVVLALTGCASVITAWATYLATIPKGTVPARPVGTIILQLGGAGLAVAGIFWSLREGETPGVAVIAPAAFALMMGLGFIALLTQRKTPVGDIKVKVGDGLLPFTAHASDGRAFHSDSLAGRRILLKFFRGGW